MSDTSEIDPVSGLDRLRERLNRFDGDLDLAWLRSCVVDRFRFDRDQVLWASGLSPNHLYLLGSGFGFDFTILSGGKRHIFDFYGPGAFLNWPKPSRAHAAESYAVKAKSEVLFLDRAALERAFEEEPDAKVAMEMHEMRRAMLLSQRVRALISLPAKDRMRILLLDIANEFSWAGCTQPWYPLTLTQEEIGDLIGSTSVHVSRTLSALEQDGEIERRGQTLRLTDAEGLKKRLSYRPFA